MNKQWKAEGYMNTWQSEMENALAAFIQTSLKTHKSAREETMSVTEEIGKVESEMDAPVKGLYGL